MDIERREIRAGRELVYYRNNPSELARTFSHEQVHAVTYRELGSADVPLEEWEDYKRLKGGFHLSLGGDLVYAAVVGISALFPHHQRPSEWNALNLDQE